MAVRTVCRLAVSRVGYSAVKLAPTMAARKAVRWADP
jgi:hypothetical protein